MPISISDLFQDDELQLCSTDGTKDIFKLQFTSKLKIPYYMPGDDSKLTGLIFLPVTYSNYDVNHGYVLLFDLLDKSDFGLMMRARFSVNTHRIQYQFKDKNTIFISKLYSGIYPTQMLSTIESKNKIMAELYSEIKNVATLNFEYYWEYDGLI